VAVLLARDYDIPTIIKMSNTDYIYDKDPKKYVEAKPMEKISWKDYRAMAGDRWILEQACLSTPLLRNLPRS